MVGYQPKADENYCLFCGKSQQREYNQTAQDTLRISCAVLSYLIG